MQFHNNWIESLSSEISPNMFHTKDEMTDSVKNNFDFRRKYSNEGETILIDGLYEEQCLIQDHTNPINEDKTDRKLHLPIDTKAISGSKIIWDNSNWLIVSKLKNIGNAYKITQIQECNYTLPYQLNSSTILQEPCIVDNPQETTIGQNQGNLITVPSHLLNVFVQYNDNTSKIEIGKHLYIDRPCPHPSVYEITQIDRVTYMNGEHGLLKFTCNASTIGDKDRTDLLIADYISDTPVVPSETGSVTITSPDNAFTVDFGSSKTFTAIYKDSSGQALSGITSVWSYILPDGYQDKIHITVNDNNISIKTDSDFNLIDKVIRISVHDDGNTYSATQDIKVVSGFGI